MPCQPLTDVLRNQMDIRLERTDGEDRNLHAQKQA
jgi:hypothetical protein